MKKIFLTLALTVALIFTLAVVGSAISVLDSNGNEYVPQSFSFRRQNGAEVKIANTFYLPSCTTPGALRIMYNDESTEIISLGDATTDSDGNACYVKTIDGTSYTFYFANSLPSVYVKISLTFDQLLGNKEKDEAAKTTIMDKFGSVSYTDTDAMYSEIRVRGNATQNYQKLPFQLKLNNKASVLGMAEAKTWILLANYDDQSILRNCVSYKIGELLGMDTCDFRNVDLYINGEYQGIYLLCEKVQIQENRVNIYDLEEEMDTIEQTQYGYPKKVTYGDFINETGIKEYQYMVGVKTPEDISGGYLIELDNNYYKDENSYFITKNGHAYVVKSPENCSKEQVEYIARIFAEMEDAINSSTGKNSRGLHYSQYIDVDSLVYAYIVAEITRNWDAASSLYFYKDRDVNGEYSKIVKGPLWDCDNTLGNMLKADADNTQTYWAKTRSFWKPLTNHAYFNYRVAEEYEKIYPTLISMASQGGYIDQLVDELGSSIVMEQSRWQSNDYTFWPMYSDYVYSGVHYDQWQSSQTFQFFDTYSNGVDNDNSTTIGHLKTWVSGRASWLHDEWSSQLSTSKPGISQDGFIDNTLKPPMIELETPTPTPPPVVDT